MIGNGIGRWETAWLTYDLLSELPYPSLLLVQERDIRALAPGLLYSEEYSTFAHRLAEEYRSSGSKMTAHKRSILALAAGRPICSGHVAAVHHFGPVSLFATECSVQISEEPPQLSPIVALMPNISWAAPSAHASHTSGAQKQLRSVDKVALLESYGVRFERLIGKYFEDVAGNLAEIRSGGSNREVLRNAFGAESVLSASVKGKLDDLEAGLNGDFGADGRRIAELMIEESGDLILLVAVAHNSVYALLDRLYELIGLSIRAHSSKGGLGNTLKRWQERLGPERYEASKRETELDHLFEAIRRTDAGASSQPRSDLSPPETKRAWVGEILRFAAFVLGQQPISMRGRALHRPLPAASSSPPAIESELRATADTILGLFERFTPETRELAAQLLKRTTRAIDRASLIDALQRDLAAAERRELSKLRKDKSRIGTTYQTELQAASGFGEVRQRQIVDCAIEATRGLVSNLSDEDEAAARMELRQWVSGHTQVELQTVVIGVPSIEQVGEHPSLPELRLETGTRRIEDRLGAKIQPLPKGFEDLVVDALHNRCQGSLRVLPSIAQQRPDALRLRFLDAWRSKEAERMDSLCKLVSEYQDLYALERKTIERRLDLVVTALNERSLKASDSDERPLVTIDKNHRGPHYVSNLGSILAEACPAAPRGDIRRTAAAILRDLQSRR